jgi:phosphate transport system substrate-binding protein
MRILIVLIMGLVPFVGFANSVPLRVVGSDLLGPDFEGALKTFSTRESLPVTTSLAGSRIGLEELKTGKADVALVAFAPGEEMPKAPYLAQPLAYCIAVIAVPEHIAATQIFFNQLDGFFGAEGPAGFAFWRDVGVVGSSAQLAVTTHVLAGGPNDELSADLFAHVALRVPRLKSSVSRYQDIATLRARLSAEEGGLAVLPYVPAFGSGLRALLVAKGEGEPAFGPTPENVHSGDYPLRLPVYVVYRGEDAARLRGLRLFFWSHETAGHLAKNRAILPVPASGRPALR